MAYPSTHVPGLPRRFGVRAYLVALSLALLVPSLGLGGIAVWSGAEAYRTGYRERMQDIAHAMALAVDGEISTLKGVELGLAGSRHLDSDATQADHVAFHAEAKKVGDAVASWLAVFGSGPDFRMLVNTKFPPGTLLPSGSDMPNIMRGVSEVFETRQVVVGDVALRKPLGVHLAVVSTPIVRNDRVVGAISMPLNPARIQNIIHSHGFSEDLLAVVLDSRGRIVARSAENDRYVGNAAPDWYRQIVTGQDSGFVRGRALNGIDTVVAFSSMPSAPGWNVSVSQPMSVFAAKWQRPILVLSVGGAIVIISGTALAVLVARRLLRPVAALTRYANEIASQGERHVVVVSAWLHPFTIDEFEDLRLGFVAARVALQEQNAKERHAADAARASEAALAESEARLARAIDSARIGAWEWDAVSDRLTGSRGFEALFGLRNDALLTGTPCSPPYTLMTAPV